MSDTNGAHHLKYLIQWLSFRLAEIIINSSMIQSASVIITFKMNFREVKWVAKCQGSNKWWRKDSNFVVKDDIHGSSCLQFYERSTRRGYYVKIPVVHKRKPERKIIFHATHPDPQPLLYHGYEDSKIILLFMDFFPHFPYNFLYSSQVIKYLTLFLVYFISSTTLLDS